MRRSIWKRMLTGAITASMVASMSVPYMAVAVSADTTAAFASEFANPGSNDAKPFVRWWIAPGRMNEEEVNKEVKNFADKGYGGIELQCLELSKYSMNTKEWNEVIKWILKAGIANGIEIDFTIGQLWPIASPDISNVDDSRLEQQIWNKGVDFQATADNKTYSTNQYIYPDPATSDNPWQSVQSFDTSRKSYLIAITAAKKAADGSYDSSSAIDVLKDSSTKFNKDTGEISWTAPSEGDWTVFYFYGQTANHTTMYSTAVDPSVIPKETSTQYVVDHLSAEGTQDIIDSWENAMNSDPELKTLYEENAGSIFGDSFELRSNLWTPKMLEEFKARRGYDLTPYLPALTQNFNGVEASIREDLYKTMTELLSENHMGKFREWAHSHNMTLRYQAYSSAGQSNFELTDPALNTDIIEAESYAMSGDTPDAYKQLSGAVNMRGYQIYSAEAAEIGSDDWRETWTRMPSMQDGTETRYPGFMHYAYRLFAGGVNKVVFHGATYHLTDTSGLNFAPKTVTWPGYSAMAGMSYGNEWDNKTPMWENADIMTASLARTQGVLQQGQGDVDLAIYRNQYGKGNVYSDITAIEQNGYTYDYVTPTILNMDNATIGSEDGKTVLATDGPSYKAMIIEPMGAQNVPTMPLTTAEKILAYAEAGLPVVIIGDTPTQVDSFNAEGNDQVSADGLAEANQKLADIMTSLKRLSNVKQVASRDEAPEALKSLNVTPDASMATASDVYFVHRADNDVEYYYIYNDGDAEQQNVTLTGNGVPYLLDPWSGEITPIYEYTVSDDKITIPTDISSEDMMLVAIAPAGWNGKTVSMSVASTTADTVAATENGIALRTTTGGTLEADLGNGEKKAVDTEKPDDPITVSGWKMTLNRWESAGTDDPYATNITQTQEYDLSETGLVPWYDIDENLTNAVGTADYTATFELNRGWSEGQGAYLSIEQAGDVVRLMINDQEVPLDQISLKTDIGKYVKAGTNTIKATVSSNMSNAMEFSSGWGANKTVDTNKYSFGLIGNVMVTPYSQVEILKNRSSSGSDGTGTSTDSNTNNNNSSSNSNPNNNNGTDNSSSSSNGKFIDVPESGDLKTAVDWGTENGIVMGTSATTFNPTGNVTRAQFVTFLYRLADSPDTQSALPFTDCENPGGTDFQKAIAWAAAEGIAKGKSVDTFDPHGIVKREEAVAFLHRYFKTIETGDEVKEFSDVAENAWYASDVDWGSSNGIVNGYTDGLFGVGDTCTRGQAVQFIYRATNK